MAKYNNEESNRLNILKRFTKQMDQIARVEKFLGEANPDIKWNLTLALAEVATNYARAYLKDYENAGIDDTTPPPFSY